MPSKEAKTNGRSCLICGGKSEGANSGVESCRACSAFFRRSVTESMKYVCKNELKCAIKRDQKRMCRACRLRRCLEVGMLPEHVKSATRHSSVDTDVPGPSKPIVEDDEFFALHSSRIPMLTKIGTLYHLSRSRRFYSELALLPIGAKKPSIADPVEAQQLHPCDVLLADNLWKTNLKFITEFCANTFEEFATLEKSDKFDLFRSFIATLFIYELEEATAMSKLELENKRQMSRTTFIDFTKPELFFSTRESTADDKFLKTWSEACRDESQFRIFSELRNLKPSVIERAAIIGLLFANIDDLDMPSSEETIDLCISMRTRLMRELHVYYTEILHKTDYCLRLGKILDHLHETITHARVMRDELVMYVMIGAMQSDITLFDLIRV